MNDSIEEELSKKRNMLYYNQLVMNERRAKSSKERGPLSNKKKVSFGSQKVEFSDFLYAPEGWESVVYTIYFVGVPYVVGAVFLFFFVAGGDWENFKLLDFNAFPIVWAIGYEIVAVIALIWIMILYLQYDDDDDF
ncbi:hypothetical protein [Sulfurimonas sp.]